MSDTVLRAMTNDGSFRVIAAATTETTRQASAAQKASGDTAARFAELLTGAIIVRETMAPSHRVQGILKGAGGSGSLVADSHPDGGSRGLVQQRAAGKRIALGEGSLLQMMRTMPSGALHQGIVEVPEPGGISSALMAYMQQSEQIESVIAVGAVCGEGGALLSGGYLVQLLPEAKAPSLSAITAHLDALGDITTLLKAGLAAPSTLVAKIFADMPYTLLEESPLAFTCRCSKERVIASLLTIQRDELAAMIEEAKPLDISCDYCGTDYVITTGELTSALQEVN